MSTESGLLIFDWSGVISDDRMPVFQSNLRMGDQFQVEFPRQLEEWLKGTLGNAQDKFRSLGVTLSPDEIFAVYKDTYAQVVSEGMRPTLYEDAGIVLDGLKSKGKKLVVVSSHPQESLKREANEYGIAGLFDEIIGGVGEKSKVIGDTAKSYLMNPLEAIYIGDTIFDVRSAKTANVVPVAVTYGYHSREMLEPEKPAYILDHIREVADF